MSAIGNRLFIAKQNMTPLIDRLGADGLVERKNDPGDRRVINIVVTQKGIGFLKESTLALKKIIKENLVKLSDEDIELFHNALQSIKTVFERMDKGDSHASD